MPVAKNIVTSAPLRNVSIYFKSPEFVADQVFPMLDINNPTAKITKYLESDFFRNDAGVRGEGGEARRGGFKTTEISYSTIEYAFAVPVTDELRRNSKKLNAQPLTPDADAIELAKRKIMMNREGLVSQLVLGSTWLDGVSGGADAEGGWAAAAGTNTFIADMYDAKQALRARGIAPGSTEFELRVLMDDITFDEVIQISAVKDQFKYTSAESITAEMLARFLKVDKVLTPSTIYNSDEETVAGTEFTAARFWEQNAGKGMCFVYAFPKRIGPRMLCAGLQVRDLFDAEEGGGYERVSRWRESKNHQMVYEVAENRDELQICSQAGYLFKDTISD